MGFKKQETRFELRFADSELEGLEVSARSVSSGALLELMDHAQNIDVTRKSFQPSDLKAVRFLLEGFAGALVSWNLEDEQGCAVPATIDSVKEQEFTFIMPIVTAWMDAVAGVSSDLGKDSGSGETFPVESIPMETLS